jgi:diguanylate cyclase (GGDEF)-like protein
MALFSRLPSPPSRSLSLMLVVPFMVLVVLTVGLTGVLALQTGRTAVNQAVEGLRTEISQRIVQQLDDYLAYPHLINQAHLEALETGRLAVEPVPALETYLWRQARLFEVVDFLYYGNEQGEFAGGGWPRGRDHPMQRHRVTPAQPELLQFFNTDDQGNIVAVDLETPGFDPRSRAWYQSAVEKGAATWSPIFTFQAFPAMAISASVPVYDDQGNLVGVFANNFFLTRISNFLASLEVGQTGQSFVVEPSGLVVAASTIEQPFTVVEGQAERYSLAENPDPVLKAAGDAIATAGGLTNGTPRYARELTFDLGRDRHFLQLTRYQDEYGLDWIVGVIVPEADFMAQIWAYRRTTLLLCLLALGISGSLGWLTARQIARPISRMSQAAQVMAAGDLSQPVQFPSSIVELSTLGRSFNQMAQQLAASFAELQHQATHDSLTQLPNRAALMTRLSDLITQTQGNPDRRFAVLFLDLDNFKLVNDSYGHLIGDQLLIVVSQRIVKILPDKTLMVRFGGDEFVILLEEIETVSTATRVADRIAQVLSFPFKVEDHEIYMAVSMGIVLSMSGETRASQFLRDADTAMYQAKARGKGRYEVFTQRLHEETTRRLSLETELRRGLTQEELTVYYQPIVALDSLEIVGVEALVRWQHPKLGLVPPSQFIPVAEEAGMIVSLGNWVLHQACGQMRQWQQQHLSSSLQFISVNLSTMQFVHPNFLEQLDYVLTVTGLNRTALKLEITESIMLNNAAIVQARLRRLRQSGIRFSIDDFGTGYSSLSYLNQFPVDSLKIDQAFVSQLDQPTGEPVVRAILALAQNLNLSVIAEGVEVRSQLQHLLNLGCEMGQGYLFARPMPAAEIAALLGRSLSVE